MTKIGYFLSCEEWGPRELISQARMAEEAGFEALWISDHYHPWTDEQAASLVTEDTLAGSFTCGPDPEEHLEQIGQYVEAGYDEVYVQQIGPEQEGFFRFYEKEILPKLR